MSTIGKTYKVEEYAFHKYFAIREVSLDGEIGDVVVELEAAEPTRVAKEVALTAAGWTLASPWAKDKDDWETAWVVKAPAKYTIPARCKLDLHRWTMWHNTTLTRTRHGVFEAEVPGQVRRCANCGKEQVRPINFSNS